ncbi:antitoxin Xre/MbcA/ParS toxin-binding domain-containing protein [Vibrio breoganii]
MPDINRMLTRLFSLWNLDDTQQIVLTGIVGEDEYVSILLLQIHAMLGLLYPNHPVRYDWVMRSNRCLGGARPIDVMLGGASGIQQIRDLLKVQLLR